MICNKNKRKQKLETKTKTFQDDIEFDVELSESSDEFITDSSESEDSDKHNETLSFYWNLHKIKQEKDKSIVKPKSVDPKYRKEIVQKDINFIKTSIKEEKKKRPIEDVYEETKHFSHVISERDKLAYNMYRKAYCEMDEEESVYAWNALAPREHKLWRQKSSDTQDRKRNKSLNLCEQARYSDYSTTNYENDDLDLPTLFPDAATEVKKLLTIFADKLSEVKLIWLAFGSGLQEAVEQFTKLTEFQKYFVALSNETVNVDRSSLSKHFVAIRKIVFHQRLKCPAMNSILNFENFGNDDFVYVQTRDSPGIKIARIKEKHLNGKVIIGCQFVLPNNSELEQICPIYRNNLIMINDGTEFRFKHQEIIGRCIVLNFSDYISARPTDIPEQDVYFCTHIKTSKRLIRPVVVDELTNVLEMHRGEIYYFKFDGTEDLVYDNQALGNTSLKMEHVSDGEEFLVKPEVDFDGNVVNSQIDQEVQIKVENQEEGELIIPDIIVHLNDQSEFSKDETSVDQPVEIILYDDTTSTINLADTENVLFVINKKYSTNNCLEDGEIIEID